jgi:hypothetical protein
MHNQGFQTFIFFIATFSVAKQLFCLLLIAIIGLIGGAVFQSLEQPNQEYEIIREKEVYS